MDDGCCNGGDLPETYIIGNQLHYQDNAWYEALEDSKLKDEALRNKVIMEGLIKEDDDESHYEQMRRWNINANYDDAYETNHENNDKEELCEVHELPVCNIRRYMMIKYLFNNDEEYVAVKEDKYDDLTITREEACRSYQEIFWKIDEGWMDDGEVKSVASVMEIVSPNHSKALAKWQVQPTRASMFSVSPSELLPLVDHLYPSNAVPSSKEKNEHSQFAFSICTSLNINHW
ncbi:hypothetical protein Tco_0894844 [Tanacetum coccineum]|uniref:Uncharacterized protein n=1 Tax=Tanacetum coccineum TaxID=301880 RepID=A0ABQ5CEC0_9ASTR